jgi:ketosteroid isomerase-like protein
LNGPIEERGIMEDQVRKTVESYFRLVNEEKFDEFFALFDPDVEFKAPFHFTARGLEQVKPFYLRVPTDFPHHVDTPEEILVSGNRAAVYIDFVGTSKEGVSVAFKASDWFLVEDGKIKSLHIFYDSHFLAKAGRKKK